MNTNTFKYVSQNNNFFGNGQGLVTAELNKEIVMVWKTKRLNQETNRHYTEYYIVLHDEYNPSNRMKFLQKSFKQLQNQIESYPNKLFTDTSL